MIGSRARSAQGPPGTCRAAFCVGAALALAAGLGACAPPAAPLPFEPPGTAAAPDAGRLAAARAAFGPSAPDADRPAADSFAAAAFRAAGLTSPFERRFHVGSPGAGPLVAALLAGGHPGDRDSLVVAVAVGPEGAAALLEAARMLAARSAFVAGPGRSLLVALAFDGAAPSATPATDAADAAARALGAPLWAPSAVRGLVAVGPGAAGAGAAARERGLAFAAVEPGPAGDPAGDPEARAVALALAAYDALGAALRPPDPPLVSAVDTAAAAR